MAITVALAGNPNSGKTTLFNALTGSNQFVGNWPGVTVEKKEGRLKGHPDVTVTDLPGIYSLSPYTLEEVVARNYLIGEHPDVILNIVDGTNLERNLYLTTQLMELGIPLVVAVNMMDTVEKRGDVIRLETLAESLGCTVVAISALRGTGLAEAVKQVVAAAGRPAAEPVWHFDERVETALSEIERRLDDVPEKQQRFYAVKLFERDSRIASNTERPLPDVTDVIQTVETAFEDDSESIITGERYACITSIIQRCHTRKNREAHSISDRIDRIVTNRWAALPIFAAVMFLVYFVSVTTVGTWATDWANDGVFGDGWHLFGIGSADYEEEATIFDVADTKVGAYIDEAEAAGIDVSALRETLATDEPDTAVLAAFEAAAAEQNLTATAEFIDDETGAVAERVPVSLTDFQQAITIAEPDPADYGIWVPGVPALVEGGLEALGTADWLNGLILNGIVAGVGAVLGFVPQILVLFLFLAFLEACGYMARIAFIMDRIFRKFGLSGKSFIPMLIGTGCGVPGIMASRTIENARDRRMTIITTTFIPCGAKLPIIALIAGALFGGAWWVAPSAYFIGIAAIICSGILLKKTRMFAGDPAPFVMELPAYHWPAFGHVLRSMWERGWSFIRKAGTIILLATIFVWFTSSFGFTDSGFGMVEMDDSLLAAIGSVIAPLFVPLGWGEWQAAVAAFTGLIAKENVVGTFGVLYGSLEEVAENGWQIWAGMREVFTGLSAYSFLVFNLLCAPCFAAIGAIRREMNSAKWTWFAIGYQCVFAYMVSLCIYQFGSLFTGGGFSLGTLAAILFLALFLFLLFRPEQKRRYWAKNRKEAAG